MRVTEINEGSSKSHRATMPTWMREALEELDEEIAANRGNMPEKYLKVSELTPQQEFWNKWASSSCSEGDV